MSSSSPILIGGCPRSGTTAVLQMFNSCPNVFISSEENLLNARKVLNKLFGTLERRTNALGTTGMRELSPRETLTVDNIHSHNFSQEAVFPTLQFIYEYHHAQMYPDASLLLWGDKLPSYAKNIGKILALPKVKYLHITRNPLDVINSMLRRLNAAKSGRDWWSAISGFNEMLDVWAESYKAISAVEHRSDVLHLHYEEVVFNFDINVDVINQFLQTKLKYKNIMVADYNLHYSREFITQDMIKIIKSNTVVREYIKRYKKSHKEPSVSTALEALLK